MKKNLILLCGLVVMGVLSCGSQEGFKDPRPANGTVLKEIPTPLHGRYVASDGESVLTINGTSMVRVYDFDVKCTRDKMPPGYILHGDTLSILDYEGSKETQIVERINDSTIAYHEHLLDTLFVLNPYSVMKILKGNYFLNEHIETDSNQYIWEVRAMGLQHGLLTLSYVDDDAAIGKLPTIATDWIDTMPSGKIPVKKKYKDIEDEDLMEKTDSFYRVGL